MVARALLRELEGRGVRLVAEGGQLVARGPSGAITPELAGQIKVQRDALLRELQGEQVNSLPAPLILLVQAAVGHHLDHPVQVRNGQVPHMGTYVLACAAQYVCGVEPGRQVEQLWELQAIWRNKECN